jgi:Tfp pilus assembly protein FimT
MEVAVVIGITTVLAGIGWPLTSRLLDRSQLVAATDTLRAEVRAAQREARASGRVLEMRVDPSAGVYVIGPVGDAGRVRFGSITVRSRTGARRVTVSITGHTSIARWDGRQWQ